MAAIGSRIRALRQFKGLTLAAFAEAVGVSSGMVSQVERGLTDPSLETLRRIARELGVPLFSIFQDDAPAEAVRVVRNERRMFVRSPHGEITYSRVSAGPGQLEVLVGTLGPGGASSQQLWSHPSEECALIMSGELVLHVNDESFTLGEGDSCTFDSRLPHRYENLGTTHCRFVLSITPPSY